MKKFDDIKKYFLFRAMIKRFVLPIIVLFMIDQGLSVEQIALIAAVSAVVGIILEVPSGAISDTIGHRRTLIISVIGQGLSMALYLGGSFYWIFAGGVLYWASGTLLSGTMSALFFERLEDMGRAKEFQKLSGQVVSFSHGVGIVSMLLAGVAYVFHPFLPFMVNIGMFVVAGIAMYKFKEVKAKVSVEEQEAYVNIFSHFGVAAKTIVKQPFLFWMILSQGLVVGVLFAMLEFDQIVLTDIGVLAAMLGVIYAVKRLIVMVMAPFVHLLTKYSSPPTVLIASFILGITYLLLVPLMDSAIMLSLVVLLPTITHNIVRISTSDYMNQLIPSGSRATTLSMNTLLMNLSKVAVFVLVGWIGSLLPLQEAYGIIGFGLMVMLVPISYFLIKSYRGSELKKKLVRA